MRHGKAQNDLSRYCFEIDKNSGVPLQVFDYPRLPLRLELPLSGEHAEGDRVF